MLIRGFIDIDLPPRSAITPDFSRVTGQIKYYFKCPINAALTEQPIFLMDCATASWQRRSNNSCSNQLDDARIGKVKMRQFPSLDYRFFLSLH